MANEVTKDRAGRLDVVALRLIERVALGIEHHNGLSGLTESLMPEVEKMVSKGVNRIGEHNLRRAEDILRDPIVAPHAKRLLGVKGD